MNTNVYTLLDIATYEWIKINNLELSQFSNSSEKSINRSKLVAKWYKNDDGQLYCYWSSR